MKALNYVVCLSLLIAIGCASDKWQAEQIPYPRSTPFDSNEFARVAYLDGFRSGYRQQRYQTPTTVDLLTGPNLRARELGFRVGAATARAEMAKEAESTQ